MKKNKWITGFCLFVVGICAQTTCLSQKTFSPAAQNQSLVFSAVRGTKSKPDTILLSFSSAGSKIDLRITGERAGCFRLISTQSVKTAHGQPSKTHGGQKIKLILAFVPDSDFVGVARAALKAVAAGKTIREFDLRGLSLKGLEGANEPTLASVFDALGYRVDPGWAGLANDLRPDPEGEEVHAAFFRKTGEGKVDIQPLARFSPDYALPFGYFTRSSQGPQLHQLGILAKTEITPQNQTLFPALSAGTDAFDPGQEIFGIYTTSPTHTAFTADDWNLLGSPDKAGHATRIYPAKDQNGKLLANTYLLCFEEAQNGDYQDYVFVLKNVTPLTEQEEYAGLMNGRDLDGWNIFLQQKGLDNDADHNFAVEEGTVHVRGKELGYMRTKKEFTDYHFKVEFKWGEKKWPPREGAKRDAGVCYNIPTDEPDSIWPRSIECQVQEGDVGDFWLLSGSTIEVDGQRNLPSNHTRIIKKKDGEKPIGEWNTVEVISYRGRCIQIVNGVEVNDGGNASIKSGRILLQSEYSEVYYRNARISQLTKDSAHIPVLATGTQKPMPDEWIDSATHHKIMRLTRLQGNNASFYFHNDPFIGNKMLFYNTGANKDKQIFTVDLGTLKTDQVTHQASPMNGEIAAKKSRSVYYQIKDSVFATNIDTHETKLVFVFPPGFTGAVSTVNADETLLGGVQSGDEAKEILKEHPEKSEYFNRIYDAHISHTLFTIDIRTGQLNKIHQENTWIGHVQFSPTDPSMLMFCHEGPWQKVDRIWLIDVHTREDKLMHKRTVDNEIAGHEFFGPDGRTIWFDWQIPKGQTFYLGSVDTKTGLEKKFQMTRDEWSIHFNITRDQQLFAGDGGDSGQVAKAKNGRWIYLFRPERNAQGVDHFVSEKLVDMKYQYYKLEPNVHFSPDGKWIIFRANFEGREDVYAVQLKKG